MLVRRFAALPLICLSAAMPARAQDVSAWASVPHAAARLLAGELVKTPAATFLRAGVEIRLDPGWVTYWRYPGDSGVPPTFDFGGSRNVKAVTVRWPAPKQISDGGDTHSIGYENDVVLPLEVTPQDGARTSSLHLALHYAICGKLCVPAEAKLELNLNGKGAEEPVIEQAERQVPQRTALGVADEGLAIRSVRREAAGKHDRVVVEVTAPAGAAVSLFVEGPTPQWALPIPEESGPASPLRRFSFDLEGVPPGAQAKGATLTFTAVSGGNAIQVPARLD
jgi:DsbC/DsbD-like thiol-disulfide interchange protein